MSHEKRLAYHREYYRSEKSLAYRMEYYRSGKNKAACKRWYEKHKDQKRQYAIEQGRLYRESWLKLVAQGCVICGKTVKPNNNRYTPNKIHLHEKNGKNHSRNSYIVYALHADEYDFVVLCYKHHRMVHTMTDFYKMDEIQQVKIMELVEKPLRA